jgi:DNA-binding Xre family transcriptional regulator
MMRAYDENAIEYAMENLGTALDYSVNGIGIDGQEFLDLFVSTGIATEFGNGNPRFVTGMSGQDLADRVYEISGKRTKKIEGDYNGDYTPEYWCGWILAYYQWVSCLPFKKILLVINFQMLMDLYGVLHEADVTKAESIFDDIVRSESFLARMRKSRGMSQSQLAKASGVSLRSIQLYEQKKNDINKAQYNNLKAIAKVLYCEIEDILE